MFQSFTGNSRRRRQVNLSSRTADPFATAQSSFTAGPPGGSNSAIANAQLERRARQSERERLNASRTIQRVWRGHLIRKSLRSERKELLLASEDKLRALPSDGRSLGEIQNHVSLCVQTVWPQLGDEWTAERILWAGQWIYEKAPVITQALRSPGQGDGWAASLRSFIRTVIKFLNAMLFPTQRPWAEKLHVSLSNPSFKKTLISTFQELENQSPGFTQRLQRCFVLLGSLITIFDTWTEINWTVLQVEAFYQVNTKVKQGNGRLLDHYYRFLGRMSLLNQIPVTQHEQQNLLSAILSDPSAPSASLDTMSSLIAAPALSLLSGNSPTQKNSIHSSMVMGFLTVPELANDVLEGLGSVVDRSVLYRKAQDAVVDLSDRGQIAQCQYLLANLIRQSDVRNSRSEIPELSHADMSFDADFMSFVSSVLDLFASLDELESFTVAQLHLLASADTISKLFRETNFLERGPSISERTNADILSDYILNILRLLPQQADEIRMHLYISHRIQSRPTDGLQKSAVRFFWTAVRESSLFKQALKGWIEVRSLLPDASPQRRSGWKVVILFIEIYSFALRFQDDDEFIGGLKSTSTPNPSTSNTLHVTEIQRLVEFLKNVSYCLYLKSTFETSHTSATDATDLRTVFSTNHNTSIPGTGQRAQASRGVNTTQLKEAITALLRALYERDSRRKFLPEGSFLMVTDEAESQNFVSTVMRENLVKQKLDDESEDDDTEEAWYGADTDEFDRDRARNVMPSQHLLRVQRQNERERHQRIMAKRRARQEAAPRIELLENIPFLIPFETRVQLFRMHVNNDMIERRGGDANPDSWRFMLHASRDHEAARSILSAHQAELRRDAVFEDAFEAFNKLGEGLKEPIRISFVGEEGIDGGGVTKEFLTSVINDVFRVNSPYHLFSETDDHMLYPSSNVLDEADAELDMIMRATGQKIKAEDRLEARKRILEYYRFAGRLVGKCLYEGILVDIPLARFFVTKWALTGGDGAARHETTYRPGLNDMWDYDKAIYKGLLDLQNSKDDVSTWGMTFAVNEEVGGRQVERVLKPGGADITVNNNNRLEYISRMVKYYLMIRQGSQTRAFLDGLGSIIKPTWLRMFNEAEIRVLLGGESRPIDVEDLRRNTVYSGVYQIGNDGMEHPTIRMFWEMMHAMEDADRRKLLQYVTSTPNAPLMGFAHLYPRFSIRDSQSDQGRLPTSSTCANLLKLPIYKTEAVLRDRIMTAINSGAGFDLS